MVHARPTAAAVAWLIAGALAMGLAIAALDVWLLSRGGYRATITGVSRGVLAHWPVAALGLGLVAGGLYAHFFHAFAQAGRGPAPALFWAGALLGAAALHRFLYG
jgi:hypothetical protein